MTNYIKFIIICLFVSPTFAKVTAYVDRNPINIQESVRLTFNSNENTDDSPDFAPLKQNFTIVGQNKQSNISFVNGQRQDSKQWVLDIFPNKSGKLLIPAINFGSQKSNPITLSVLNKPTNIADNQDLFFEVMVDNPNPYVQAEVIYTMRIFFNKDIAQWNMTKPDVKDAIIQKIGKDTSFNTNKNGVLYQVIEQKYAIFPQKSGTVIIKPSVLDVDIITGRNRGFFGGNFTHRKRIISESINLTVQAVPDNFKSKQWLASKQVSLTEQWSTDVQNIPLGEPITRTLKIESVGNIATQLPKLFTKNKNFKNYTDDPSLKTTSNIDIIGTREEKIAYIINQPGTYTLPEIIVPWFDTNIKKIKLAKLPAQEINVVGSVKTAPTEPIVRTQTKTINKQITSSIWQWLTVIFASLWLITLWFWYQKSVFKNNQPKVKIITKNITFDKSSLKNSCDNNNPIAAKNALLKWGKLILNSHNLTDIANNSTEELSQEIEKLQTFLYQQNKSTNWDGRQLWLAFNKNNIKKSKQTKKNPLENLHKIT